jgi:hypothetical protein
MYNHGVCVLLDASIELWYYYIQDIHKSSQSSQISSIDIRKRIYEELHEHFMLSSDMSNQEDSIGLLLGSEDVIGIESIRSRIEYFDEVEQANAFLPIKLACPQEWIVKAIDKKLSKSDSETKEFSEKTLTSKMH